MAAELRYWYAAYQRWYTSWRHDAGLQDKIIPTQAERWRAVTAVKPRR